MPNSQLLWYATVQPASDLRLVRCTPKTIPVTAHLVIWPCPTHCHAALNVCAVLLADDGVLHTCCLQARRRLARQFRKHKLEPQPAAVAPVELVIPGLNPRPQRRLLNSYVQQPAAQVGAAGLASAAELAATAAALQQLEWQFRLDPAQPDYSSRIADSSSAPVNSVASQLSASLLSDAVTSEPGSEITKAIKRASDWRQVRSLVQEHGSDLSTVHICACITHMVQLQDSFNGNPQVTVFLQQLMSSVAAVQHLLEQRQACNVLWAVSKLQHVANPSQEWLAGLYQQAMSSAVQQQANHGSCVIRHAAQLAYSLSKLRTQLPQQLFPKLTSWVLDTTQAALQEGLHSQKQVQRQQRQQTGRSSQPSQQQQHEGLQEQPSAVQVTARDLATMAWSLASLEVQPSTAWLSAFASAVSCRQYMAEANYRDLGQLIWATAKFRIAASEGAAANSVHAAAGALLQACQDTSFRSCDAQSTSNTLWALATLGQRPPVGWLNRLLQHLERSVVNSMQPQALSNSLWALAALGVVPQRSCMAALLSAVSAQMQRFDAQGVSNIIWALAALEYEPSRAWQAGFWRQSRPLLHKMTPQGLINCLWSVARLGLQPPQEWVVDVSKLLLQQGVEQLTSQGVHNVLWAMARMNNGGKQGQQLLDTALQRSDALLEQQQLQGSEAVFTIYELSGLMHTVSLLHAKDLAAGQQQHESAEGFNSALLRLCQLLQSASVPLLTSAGAPELSILFYSQVNMVANARQAQAQTAADLPVTIPRAWVDAWLTATQSCFGSASSRDLAQWLWCLAKRGVRPSGQWIASYQVATFRQMGKANSQVRTDEGLSSR